MADRSVQDRGIRSHFERLTPSGVQQSNVSLPINSEPARPVDKTIWHVLRSEWRFWVSGAIFSFVLASVLLSGWPTGLIPNVTYPFVYAGDGLSHAWMVQRVIEGWLFDNSRNGYPFGSNFLDYPGSDAGNLLIFKLLGLLGANWVAAINIYFLLSFPVIFITSYSAMRFFGIGNILSWSGALLFAFISFHIQRLGHLFYAWYFVVPIFFYVSLRLFEGGVFPVKRGEVILGGLTCVAFAFLASFGVYYAIFGAITIGISAIAGFARKADLRFIRQSILLLSLLSLGVFLNVAPNLVNNFINGKNPEVAQRIPAESEIYALKLRQLILPRVDHRVESLASLTDRYTAGAMAGYYEWSVPLGMFGGLGFLFLGGVILSVMAGKIVDHRMRLLALLTWTLFLFGTIGGLGAIFSGFVSPSIRGWDRISVFIGFGAITGLLLALQKWFDDYLHENNSLTFSILLVVFFTGLVIFDQNVAAPLSRNEITRVTYERDRNFVKQIESSVPPGAAIYQLPYIAFPEEPSRFRLFSYEPAAGFLHSDLLKWSWGGMKGRPGDRFYRALADQSIEKQVEVIRRLGFSGIYLDRRGFEDNAEALIERITVLLGSPPLLTRADGEVVFFRVDPTTSSSMLDLNAREIMEIAGFVVDKLGKRYPATLSDGIDFRRSDWPEFVRDVSGLSVAESGGRWSDATLSPTVRIDFFSNLPQNFDLVLTAFPFFTHTEQEVVIKIGLERYRLRMPAGVHELRVAVKLNGEQVSHLEFLPPNPKSPAQLGISADKRKLSMGFAKLRFE